MALYMRERRKSRRDKLIEMAGGQCVRCGSAERLEFDHRDRTTKSFVLSGRDLDKAWNTIVAELAKCDLLCRACHHFKTVENNETGSGSGHNRIDEHGTEAMYAKGCKCVPCRIARYDARVRRGELRGTRGPYLRNPL
jgi:hypothetical protein